jgi:hypothetical protein
MSPTQAASKTIRREVERQHVVMDRSTGTTVEGGLRTEKGEWPPEGIVMMALLDEALGLESFKKMLVLLCTEGWGYGRNYGYGQIELASIEPLNRPASTGHVVTLGHCHPTDDLPEDGYWRWTGVPVLAHNPDTRRAILPHRFTTMLAPGATFASDQPHVGQVLHARLPHNDDYLHNGMVPTWPVKTPEENHG